ncbi:unnamed protein product [Cutaneotrichosporon oleaginosum]
MPLRKHALDLEERADARDDERDGAAAPERFGVRCRVERCGEEAEEDLVRNVNCARDVRHGGRGRRDALDVQAQLRAALHFERVRLRGAVGGDGGERVHGVGGAKWVTYAGVDARGWAVPAGAGWAHIIASSIRSCALARSSKHARGLHVGTLGGKGLPELSQHKSVHVSRILTSSSALRMWSATLEVGGRGVADVVVAVGCAPTPHA